jgi:hypothetical protein
MKWKDSQVMAGVMENLKSHSLRVDSKNTVPTMIVCNYIYQKIKEKTRKDLDRFIVRLGTDRFEGTDF